MNPVKCPKCGKINDGNLDFCIYCGAIFEEAKPENDKFILDLRHTGKNKDSYSPYDSITYPNDERRSVQMMKEEVMREIPHSKSRKPFIDI